MQCFHCMVYFSLSRTGKSALFGSAHICNSILALQQRMGHPAPRPRLRNSPWRLSDIFRKQWYKKLLDNSFHAFVSSSHLITALDTPFDRTKMEPIVI